MDVPKLLESASLLVPEELATANDPTVADVWDYLVHDEWEVAVDLLQELGDVDSLPLSFWEALAGAAEQLLLPRSAAWCQWRAYETRHGIVRAELTLRPADQARRRTPMSGAGVSRPPWDVGNVDPSGEPILDIARIWVEFKPSLEPGGRAPVRLAPLRPERWRRVRPGQVINMYDGATVGGTAVVLEVRAP
ncbi:hypothetical protein SAMN05421812_101257 [Asanoa hainanensis]|uniref:Uncharacterized protein n=1 Tax=Asanoa hainanensis TaxID=560556 RepID=A0A239G8X4_9ACTN|nr:hypothetical protein [Asanoa hainanensis]SNS64903.1 hypothetical protein SAMN05421812_101257 [Asanoa hainanensis]